MDSGPLSEPPAPMGAAANDDPYAVLRNRGFALYLIGRFIAALGAQMQTVAVSWELYERTRSALALGLVGLMQMLPIILFFLPAGHVAENHDRKKIILSMVFVAMLSSVGLTLVSALNANVLWIYFCLFVAGVTRAFLWPASQAFLTQLVPRRLFSRAVTCDTGAFHFSSVIRPAAGRPLLALTTRTAGGYAVHAAATFGCLALLAS